MESGTIGDLDNLLDVCLPKPGALRIQRAIGLIPLISRFDPWIEY